MIPKEIVERIKNESDIVEVISDYIVLKQKGRNYLGLCPFHNEKTPSFNVSPDKQIYKCFGCQKTGNSVNFVMEHTGASFVEALELLGRKIGIDVKEYEKNQDIPKDNRREQILNALAIASDYFEQNLHSGLFPEALHYLYKRGFEPDIVTYFNLGLSPQKDDILQFLKSKSIDQEILLEMGVFAKSEDGRIYNRFRNRIIFPIKDSIGRVIAFGGRDFSSRKDIAKYINSPQTLLYDKSKVLFGIFEAKTSIRKLDAIYLVEGYADVIKMRQFGFANTVASSGTALTTQQLEILNRYSKNLYFLYDADKAGQNAISRGIDLAIEFGFDIKIVVLPGDEDPDSILTKHGKNTLSLYINQAINFVKFKANHYKKDEKWQNITFRANCAREVLTLISKIPDRLQHDYYVHELAKEFDYSHQEVEKLFEEKSKIEHKNDQKTYDNNVNKPSNFHTKNLQDKIVERDSRNHLSLFEIKESIEKEKDPFDFIKELLPEELLILNAVIKDSKFLLFLIDTTGLLPEHFISEEGRELWECFIRADRDDFVQNIIQDEELDDEIKSVVSVLAFSEELPSEKWIKFKPELDKGDWNKGLVDAVMKLEARHIDLQIKQQQEKIAHEKDEMQILEILKEINILTKSRNDIYNKYYSR